MDLSNVAGEPVKNTSSAPLKNSLAAQDVIEKIFGATGLLSTVYNGYEVRDGQVRMAELLRKTLLERKQAVIEAACGIGKSFAYLIPAMMMSESKVVIATSNITLQEQIAFKDAPFVRDLLMNNGLLSPDYSIGYLKGRNNYLCRNKMTQFVDDPQLSMFKENDSEADEQIDRLTAWYEDSGCTGDMSDLPFIPQSALKWKCFGDTESCLGQNCDHRDYCFYTLAKEKASAANMIVVNYHLLFADIVVRMNTDGNAGVIPVYDVLICDEGHEMADVARKFWELKATPFAIKMIAGALEKLKNHKLSNQLNEAGEAFFEKVKEHYLSEDYNDIIHFPDFVDYKTLMWCLDEASEFFDQQKSVVSSQAKRAAAVKEEDGQIYKKDRAYCEMFQQRCQTFLSNMKAIMKMEDDRYVYWIEFSPTKGNRKENISLHGMPVYVKDILAEQIFMKKKCVIVTSATLAAGRDFTFIKNEIGIKDCQELVEGSPYNMREQALMVVPRMENEPNDPNFTQEAADMILKVITAAQGRTMALFTSYKNMNQVHDRLAGQWTPLLKQGEKSRKHLLAEFKKNIESVLLATASFWTGVDVQGESLTCLVMDKLPFRFQGDPLAIWLKENTKNSFSAYSVPRAVLTFKQGFGRLIRHRNDIGVFVLLDTRFFTKSYGSIFQASLPSMGGTRSIDFVKTFLLEKGAITEKPVQAEAAPSEPKVLSVDDLDDDDPLCEDF